MCTLQLFVVPSHTSHTYETLFHEYDHYDGVNVPQQLLDELQGAVGRNKN